MFKRTIQRYGRTPDPETPYQKAGQLWDERIGSARLQAHNWRLAAFVCLAISAGLAAGNIWQSMQSRVTPYVIEVDRLGEARAVSPAVQNYRPTDGQIAWHLGRFVTDVRSISTDPVLVRRNWLNAYEFATERGAQFLNEHARVADPFADIGQRSVSVQITSVVRASDSSFRVAWVESTYQRGALARTERWTAILTVVLRPPRTADQLRRNPLGLFVDAIDWTRELDPPPDPRPASEPRALRTAPAIPPEAADPFTEGDIEP